MQVYSSLLGSYGDSLEKLLLKPGRFKPFPQASNRIDWESLPSEMSSYWLSKGRKYVDFDWPPLKAIEFMDFRRNGNRRRYENKFNDRRNALACLVISECIEANGSYLDQIINGIWSLCEESSWTVPAHMYMSMRRELPDINDPVVDLHAADTARLLAWTLYLLEPQMHEISPVLCSRAREEVNRRTITPFLQRNNFWWMGYHNDKRNSKRMNNWTPRCISGVLTSLLLLEQNEEKRIEGVHKTLLILDRFISSYPNDGGCDEGSNYWESAAGALFYCLELLYGATNGEINVFHYPLISDMGEFICKVHIVGNDFVNFGDGSARQVSSGNLIYRYGQFVQSPWMIQLGQTNKDYGDTWKKCVQLDYALSALFNRAEADDNVMQHAVRDVWLPELQMMTARESELTYSGFYIAAKGGHNAESHNHNDVGQFIVYVDGQPALIDVGVEEYTAATFGKSRYEIWTMQSAYHNLPTVNGVQQHAGEEYTARNIVYNSDDTKAEFSLNLEKAYPEEAGLISWRRRLILHRLPEAYVELEENFSLTEYSDNVFLSLMTPARPLQSETGVLQLNLNERCALDLIYDSEALTASIETITLRSEQLQKVWGDEVFRILLTPHQPVKEGNWSFRIQKSD